ncbi:MarR family winged helix-turn-helix transcriptional regulator [Arthrobacter pigmenti]
MTSVTEPEEANPAVRDETRLMEAGIVGDVEFLMARARALGSLQANKALAEVGLKVRSYSVLALACSGLEPSQRELAEFLRLDPSQIVALVDELEQRELVAREPDSRDRRSKIVTGTRAGRALHSKAARHVRVAEDQSLSTLSETERDLLRDLLRRVAFETST